MNYHVLVSIKILDYKLKKEEKPLTFKWPVPLYTVSCTQVYLPR